MIGVHHSVASRQIFIDQGSRTTTIDLPKEIDSTELAYVLKSDTLRAIIRGISDKE